MFRNARTVLAGKGSLRRAKNRRALAACAPFWRSVIATAAPAGTRSTPSRYSLTVPPSDGTRGSNDFAELDKHNSERHRFRLAPLRSIGIRHPQPFVNESGPCQCRR